MSKFRNLVSNLSLSPQVGSQLAFYARRLRKEKVTRTIAAVAGVAALALNMAAGTFAQPKAALASSPNDFIFGGLGQNNQKSNLLAYYDANGDFYGHKDLQAVFNYFGITRQNLADAVPGTINSGDHSLNSLGRLPHSSLDHQLSIPGQSTDIFLRPLYSWGDGISYNAFVGHTSTGAFFAVMFDCGNIVVQPTPALGVSKVSTPAAGSTVHRGDHIVYRTSFQNTGTGGALGFVVEDPVPANTSLAVLGGMAFASPANFVGNPFWSHDAKSIPTFGAVEHGWWAVDGFFNGGSGYVDMDVVVSQTAADGTQICNKAQARAGNNGPVVTPPVCVKVSVPAAPKPTPTPTPTPTPPPPPPPVVTPPPTASRIAQAKSAVNVTQSNKDATKQEAQPGDVVEYTLKVTNTGNGTEKGYVVKDDIRDILEYADVLNPGQATLKDGILSWPKADIKPNQSLLDIFQVKLKPAGDKAYNTPTSASDPQSFDFNMDDVYGNAVRVPVAKPVVGQVEVASQQLPQTGPAGQVLLFLFIAGCIYFYLRNRQLAAEVRILRVEHNQGV